ncbi:MAG TPA: Obg family GTPase CgtA, partial [Rubrobacteraceae bacterium]|nr:Obg family GTPase CgtA [Rubrobacteraceae bacterium]
AKTGEGVEDLRDLLEARMRELGDRSTGEQAVRAHRVFRPTWKGVRVEKENGGYAVAGESVERLALKTDWENPEGVERFQRELERSGVVDALRRAGAQPGDEIRIGETVFDFR